MDAHVNNKRVVRKSNFELLRILAMFGIIMFHHFGSNMLNNFISLPEGFTASNYFYDVINNTTSQLEFRTLVLDFCYGHFGLGGNLIFMLVSGYYLFGKESSLKKRVDSVKNCCSSSFFGAVC